MELREGKERDMGVCTSCVADTTDHGKKVRLNPTPIKYGFQK